MTVAMVIGTFAVCWLPNLVIGVVHFAVSTFSECEAEKTEQVWLATLPFAFLNSAINPVIYTVRQEDLRGPLKEMVHITTSSQVPDHCSQFALSDSSDTSFTVKCSHTHDMRCKRCDDLKAVLSDIETAITATDFQSGGKGLCDRPAATLKNHVRAYINEGHNVCSVQELKYALLSYGGIPDVGVAMLTNPHASKVDRKISAISKLNNFLFIDDKSVKVWRAYEVGEITSSKLVRLFQ
ncbi:hypothetical protein QZH41_002991 [Actinostola sp. cb2023]|nr:hypothetical protein QZH41_002991 [Actinostola sp. cb2023]